MGCDKAVNRGIVFFFVWANKASWQTGYKLSGFYLPSNYGNAKWEPSSIECLRHTHIVFFKNWRQSVSPSRLYWHRGVQSALSLKLRRINKRFYSKWRKFATKTEINPIRTWSKLWPYGSACDKLKVKKNWEICAVSGGNANPSQTRRFRHRHCARVWRSDKLIAVPRLLAAKSWPWRSFGLCWIASCKLIIRLHTVANQGLN